MSKTARRSFCYWTGANVYKYRDQRASYVEYYCTLKDFWSHRLGSLEVRQWWLGMSQHERLQLRRVPRWLREFATQKQS